MKTFNLNESIYVKLKEQGYVHYMNEYNEGLSNDRKKPLEYFKAESNADGFVKFQAWTFMQMFGKTLKFGSDPMFENTIRL